MSEKNNGSIHNSSEGNDGIENRIDYNNFSAANLTRSLFDENRVSPSADKDSVTTDEKSAPAENAENKTSPTEKKPVKKTVQKANAKEGVSAQGKASADIKKQASQKKKPSEIRAELDGKKHIREQKSPRSAAVKKKKTPKQPKQPKQRKKVSQMSFLGRLLWCFKWLVRIVVIVFFSVIFACVGAGLGIYIGIIRNAPALEVVSMEPDSYTSFVYDMNGAQVDEFHGEENRVYVTLDQIPQDLQNAFIAIEDERFYSHNGIDPKGIIRAAYSIVSGGRVEGASTITQQLIKNNVTKMTRNNIESKIQEQYLAIKYESMLAEELGSKKAAKDYILELYLNTIYLNHGYNGVQVAARGYYNKDVSELDLAESAVIAAITNNPVKYSPRNDPDENKARQTDILNKMLELNMITKEEYDAAISEDVYSRIPSSSLSDDDEGSVIHTYFIDGLFDQISQDLQDKYKISESQASYIIYNGGLQIYSTLDQNIQSILDETFSDASLFPDAHYCLRITYTVSVEDSETGKQEHSEYNRYVISREEADNFAADKRAETEAKLSATESIVADKCTYTIEPQSAMVIEDYHTGHVKALIGGRGEKTVGRGFNRATNSARQPGSVFKVLSAYAPGLDTGILTPASPIEDSPFTAPDGYSPSNWWGESYRGMVNPRLGIQNSMNIVAVKAMDMVGVDTCYDYLLNFGFTTLENDNHLSTALGGLTYGVTQLEVTAAYGTIGNGGVYKKPTLYTKVLDHSGNTLLDYENDFEDRQVISSGSAYCLIDMMKDVITKGTGTRAAFQSINMPLCGKTGTTQNSKDLTFVGITPYYVAGIWLGYDDYDDTVRNMENMSQSAHLVVWRTCMEKIHQSLEYKEFEKPDDVTQAYVCTYSGLLANTWCSGHYEYFDARYVPSEYCKGHSAGLYLDSKYTKSGYGYSSSGNSHTSSDNSSSYQSNQESQNNYEDDENYSPPEADGSEFNPSDENIQNAYESEFGDLEGSAENTDSAPVESAPAETEPSPPAESAPAETPVPDYDSEEPVH